MNADKCVLRVMHRAGCNGKWMHRNGEAINIRGQNHGRKVAIIEIQRIALAGAAPGVSLKEQII